MNNELKDFVERNRPEFDHRVPSQKVWDRISSILFPKKSVTLWNSAPIWRAAAILLFGVSFYLLVERSDEQTSVNDSGIQQEFADLEMFYKDQIAEKVALISSFETIEVNDNLTDDFIKLEAMYQVLLEQMKNEPSEKIKDALILNLLVRMDLLNQQLNAIDQSKSNKESQSSI